MDIYSLIRPFLFLLSPEHAHRLTLRALKWGLYPRSRRIDNSILKTTLFGKEFKNPLGLAAGFDKEAEVIGALFNLGFGFVESGTVTPKAQSGNPSPRIFRDVSTGSVINRMGFPSRGVEVFKKNIERLGDKREGIVGLNLGKNKETEEALEDYCLLIKETTGLADYLVINISSPNTPGLRDLQSGEALYNLLSAVSKTRDDVSPNTPVLVKIAPDLDKAQRQDIAKTVMEVGIEGLIISNTTLSRPDVLPSEFKSQAGGLSGNLLFDMSTELIKDIYEMTEGKISIIGVGGVSSGEQAYQKIRAGASLVQIYTALVFQGPSLVNRILEELILCLQRDGFQNIKDAVGVDCNTGHSIQKAVG